MCVVPPRKRIIVEHETPSSGSDTDPPPPPPPFPPSSASDTDPDPVPPSPPSRKRITPEPDTTSSPDPDPASPPPPPPPPPPPQPPEEAHAEDLFDALSPLDEAISMQSPPEPQPLRVVIPPRSPFQEEELYKDWSSSSWINKYDQGERHDVVSMPGTPPSPNYSPPVSDDEDDFTIRSNLDAYHRLKTGDVTFDPFSFPLLPDDYAFEYAPALPPSPSAKLVGAGVKNLGNTCFMSAILQCFTHTVPLLQGLRSCTHNSPCEVDGFCVICAFRQHFDSSLASSRAAVVPRMFVDNLNYFSSSFVRHQQEDAHEFMQCALDKLRRCFPNGEDNLVENLFGGRLISKLRCCSCGHSSDTYEPLIDLSLEIENVDTLQLALESFTKVEKMDEKFKCASCNEDVSMEKQLMLHQTPSVAAFHLKRFKRDGNSVQKIGSHVSFTMELDLQPYTSTSNGNDSVLLKYDLYAIVEHAGSSPNSGHYFCFIRSAPDKWHRMDDSLVTSVSGDVVLSHVAYILFYARQGTPWFSSIVEGEQSDPKSGLDNKQDIGDGQKDNDSTEAYDRCVSDTEGECDSAHSNQVPP